MKDSQGNIYPYPKQHNIWSGKNNFLTILYHIQEKLEKENKIFKIFKKKKDCLLCKDKNISTKQYIYKNIIWEDGLSHYIEKHNIKPTEKFLDTLYLNTTIKNMSRIINKKNNSKILKFKSNIVPDKKTSNIIYVKLTSNQILIMDALMNHGGYIKRYYENKKNKYKYRFSEHAGILDFKGNYLEKIIVSGITNRIDKGDDEIYLPQLLPSDFEYEYLFHTHPPTPKPGGRVKDGILYEFPSIGDILHFVDHYNDGKTIGSIVVTPEGLYNIRKYNMDNKKININEDKLYKKFIDLCYDLQYEAIEKYSENFNTYTFYSKIAQDTKYIKQINKELNKFKLHIDFYSRTKDIKGKWIINTVYLPIYFNK